MRGLRNKWKDQSGASILLALLFFLLCCMVGASVLMAAVSNAGKLRSNREEQQKYLLLSSALRLVCDELTSAEYYGQYKDEQVTVSAITDKNGVVISPGYSYKKYTQNVGKFECGLSDVLPLLPELDYLFAKTFLPSGGGLSQDDHVYIRLSDAYISEPAEHKLTLSVDMSAANGETETVNIQLKMDDNYSIRLTAALGNADENGYIYSMEAQLMPTGTIPDVKKGTKGSVSWTLSWIAKEEAGKDADGT